jgi:hypothetical protein
MGCQRKKGPLPLFVSHARSEEGSLGWECGGDVGRKEKEEEVEEVEVMDETERAEDFPGGDGLLRVLVWWGRLVGHFFFFSLLVSLVFFGFDQDPVVVDAGGKGRENLAFDWSRLILGGVRLGPWRIDLGHLGKSPCADRESQEGGSECSRVLCTDKG